MGVLGGIRKDAEDNEEEWSQIDEWGIDGNWCMGGGRNGVGEFSGGFWRKLTDVGEQG
jgi:hypothetical protein